MTNYLKILELLKELKEKYPSYNLGRHISTALADYGDTWGSTDKEILFAFQKYSSELELEDSTISEDYISQIIEDGKKLDYGKEDDLL